MGGTDRFCGLWPVRAQILDHAISTTVLVTFQYILHIFLCQYCYVESFHLVSTFWNIRVPCYRCTTWCESFSVLSQLRWSQGCQIGHFKLGYFRSAPAMKKMHLIIFKSCFSALLYVHQTCRRSVLFCTVTSQYDLWLLWIPWSGTDMCSDN